MKSIHEIKIKSDANPLLFDNAYDSLLLLRIYDNGKIEISTTDNCPIELYAEARRKEYKQCVEIDIGLNIRA